MVLKKFGLVALALIAGISSTNVSAEEESFLGIPGLSNSITLTSDVVGNVSGGAKRGAAELNNLDIIFDLDTEKAGLWNHGKFHNYILMDWGRTAQRYTGTLQASDNIDAPDSIKLYEAYYEHEFCDATVTTLFGLHNYNSEFDFSEYAGVFIHSSFGIDPANSQVSPSIFPTTA